MAPAPDDPFALLGLPADCDPSDVVEARRRLSKAHHPDLGGDPGAMQRVNAAADEALRRLAGPQAASEMGAQPEQPATPSSTPHRRAVHDHPSFTIEALPAEAFEALLLVARQLGDLIDDDPPYTLEVAMIDPVRAWCRLDLVPDAGSSTVSLMVAGEPGQRPPGVDAVRDLWIDGLNGLDWSELTPFTNDGRRPPS